MSDLSDEQGGVSGILRLSAPQSNSTSFLDDPIAKFGIEQPGVNVALIYEDRKIEWASTELND